MSSQSVDRFAGQVALVTGASRGIGREVALLLAREGADLALVARSEAALQSLAAEVTELGRKAVVVAADLADPEAASGIISKISDELAAPSLVVNNAGVTRDNLLLRMKKEDWDDVLALNLTATFLLTQAALKPMLRARYGRIVNVTSVVGLSGNAGQANYAASKAGLIGFTKSVAQEVARRNITVNAVAPGYIETEMTAALPDGAREKLNSAIPMGRPGSAAEIASAVAFLLSDQAAYITGEILKIDGGMSM